MHTQKVMMRAANKTTPTDTQTAMIIIVSLEIPVGGTEVVGRVIGAI